MTPALHLHLWAKLGRESWPEKYQPLLCHLIDVAAVARAIWDQVLREPMKCRLATAFGLPIKDCGRWLAFLAGAHDIGKVCPGFQVRGNVETAPLKAMLRDRFEATFPPGKPDPHGTLSTAILAEGWDSDLAVTFGFAFAAVEDV